MIVAKHGKKTLYQWNAPFRLPEKDYNGTPIPNNIEYNKNYNGPRGTTYFEVRNGLGNTLYVGSNFAKACEVFGIHPLMANVNVRNLD